MKLLGNILWIICAGFWQALGWCLFGLIWSITIVGLPVGIQCFKMAGLSFAPFGQTVYTSGNLGSTLLNILWLIFGGIELGIGFALNGVLLCITIVGIPFGIQCFKQAQLALMPFGAVVR